MGSRMRSQRGFTLGELMTAVAVTGISLSLAVPGLTSAMSTNERATAINALVASLHGARSESLARNVQVTVCPSRSGTTCDGTAWAEGWIYFADPDHDRLPGPGEVILGRGDGIPDFSVSSDEFATFLAFRPNGSVVAADGAGTSGTFVFCTGQDPEGTRILAVTALGQPHLIDPPADAPPACPAT